MPVGDFIVKVNSEKLWKFAFKPHLKRIRVEVFFEIFA